MSAKEKRTPIKEVDRKLDLIEHVNQDHVAEVEMILQGHNLAQEGHINDARILDIFDEGVLIGWRELSRKLADGEKAPLDEGTPREEFIKFTMDGDFEDQILFLAYEASTDMGRSITGIKDRYFEVLGKRMVTKNMARLEIRSFSPLDEKSEGVAFIFMMKILSKRKEDTRDDAGMSGFAKLFMKVWLWMYKRMSLEKRAKMIMKMADGRRVYTIRRAFKKDEGSKWPDVAHVDIFIHGETSGSKWYDALKKGDIILTKNETPDKHAFLEKGRALMIADETAWPALAGIVEAWRNPLPPTVLILAQDAANLAYFDEVKFPEGTVVEKIVTPNDVQAEAVLEKLPQLDDFDVSWGAMENDSAKRVRYHLRNVLKKDGKTNHMKGYWRLVGYDEEILTRAQQREADRAEANAEAAG